MDIVVEREISVSQLQRQLSNQLNAATEGAFPFWISNRDQTTHLVIPVDLLPQNLRNKFDDREPSMTDPDDISLYFEEDTHAASVEIEDVLLF